MPWKASPVVERPEPGGRPPVIRNFVACLTHMVDAAARTPCDKNRVHVVFKQGKGCHAVTERAVDLENRNYFIVMKQLQMWKTLMISTRLHAPKS